ncbi:MAG: hypothetical protein ABIS47_01615 [Acidimicrobiales bacterium]
MSSATSSETRTAASAKPSPGNSASNEPASPTTSSRSEPGPSTSATCPPRQHPRPARPDTRQVQIRVEHRMFSFISMNWRGKPLRTYRCVVELIGATTNSKGLKIRAELDQSSYPTGIKISDKQLRAVPLDPHDWHGNWNYTINPTPN